MNFEIAPKSTEMRANWYDAKQHCETLTIDGKSDWRLPTREELNAIHESENDFDAIGYWSSTEDETNKDYVFFQYFRDNTYYDDGFCHPDMKQVEFYSVRAIRDLKDD